MLIVLLRSQKTAVLKKLFAIKKGWLDPVSGELRRPPSTDGEDHDPDGEGAAWMKLKNSSFQYM